MKKYCGERGQELLDIAKFCFACGASQEDDISILEKSKNHTNIKELISDDFLYEDEFREDIEDTILSHSRGCVLSIFPKSSMSTKQIRNTINFCNNHFSSTDLVLLMDTTVMGSMKDGMAFTYTHAYKISDSILRSKIKYNDIIEMNLEYDNSYGLSRPVIKFKTKTGKIVDLRCSPEGSTYFAINKMLRLFSAICECINRYRDEDAQIIIKTHES